VIVQMVDQGVWMRAVRRIRGVFIHAPRGRSSSTMFTDSTAARVFTACQRQRVRDSPRGQTRRRPRLGARMACVWADALASFTRECVGNRRGRVFISTITHAWDNRSGTLEARDPRVESICPSLRACSHSTTQTTYFITRQYP
jgi:hypothetical protein